MLSGAVVPAPRASGCVPRPTLSASGGEPCASSSESSRPERPASVTGGAVLCPPSVSNRALHDALLRSPKRASSWQHSDAKGVAPSVAGRGAPPLFVEAESPPPVGLRSMVMPTTPRHFCENCCAGFSPRMLTDDPTSTRFCCLDCLWSAAFRQQDESRVSSVLARVERAEQQEAQYRRQKLLLHD